jgi:hypothetical protein
MPLPFRQRRAAFSRGELFAFGGRLAGRVSAAAPASSELVERAVRATPPCVLRRNHDWDGVAAPGGVVRGGSRRVVHHVESFAASGVIVGAVVGGRRAGDAGLVTGRGPVRRRLRGVRSVPFFDERSEVPGGRGARPGVGAGAARRARRYGETGRVPTAKRRARHASGGAGEYDFQVAGAHYWWRPSWHRYGRRYRPSASNHGASERSVTSFVPGGS